LDEIELQVAFELAEAEATIMQELARVSDAKHLLTNLSTPEKSAELRKIYRQLAKQLHPDVNPTLTEKQANIWHLVKEAYECCDLDKLKALQLVYEKDITAAADQVKEYSPADLEIRIEILKEGIKLLHQEIVDIRNEFPFTIEHLVKDEEWVAAETEKIQNELIELREYEEELNNDFLKLLAIL
jgi:DNA-directed RNA polymerase subunit F